MKNIFLVIIFITLVIISFSFLSNNEKEGDQMKSKSSMILFYGDNCPHCKVVDSYISTNDVKNKISFEYLEVYNNKNNANILSEKAKACGLPSNRIGVPFFWNGSECFIGDKQIITFFNKELFELKKD